MITLTNIEELKENPENPRTIRGEKYSKLVKSIREAPWMLRIRPIVVDAAMTVLGGNMRLKAAKEAGLKQVPVIKVTDLTPDQQREFIIKDNLGYGEWDWDALKSEWDTIQLEDWGMDLPSDLLTTEAEEQEQEYEAVYEIVISCASEEEQEVVFNQLKNKGYKCRVLSI